MIFKRQEEINGDVFHIHESPAIKAPGLGHKRRYQKHFSLTPNQKSKSIFYHEISSERDNVRQTEK